jgi:uncharacterized membrane protein (Fun14 family)
MTLLAAAAQAPASYPVSTHTAALGVLVGLAIGWIAPVWFRIIATIIALAAASLFQAFAHAHGHTTITRDEVLCLALIALALWLGLNRGRIMALRNLGTADFRGRLRTMRGVSRLP